LGVATTNRVVLSGPGVGGPPDGGVAVVRVFGANGSTLSGQPVAKTFTDPRLCTAGFVHESWLWLNFCGAVTLGNRLRASL